jgi:hypothetical protein
MTHRPPVDYWKRLVRIVLGLTVACLAAPLVLLLMALWPS